MHSSAWIPLVGGSEATRLASVSRVDPPAAVVPATVAIMEPGQSAAGHKLTLRDKAESSGEAITKQDSVRLADSAKCEVYVCFEGPLGAHLKPEFHEKKLEG